MKKRTPKPAKVPFNMIGSDADLVNTIRAHLEGKMGTRLSAVQVARIVFSEAVKNLEKAA